MMIYIKEIDTWCKTVESERKRERKEGGLEGGFRQAWRENGTVRTSCMNVWLTMEKDGMDSSFNWCPRLFLGFHERKIKHMRKWKTKTETEKGVCYVIVLFRTHTLYTSDIWSSPFVQCLTDIAWWTRTSRPELLLSWTWPCGNYLFWLWAVVYTHSFLERRQKGLEGMWFPPNCYRSNHTLIIHITVIQFLCVTRACSCTVALHYCLT